MSMEIDQVIDEFLGDRTEWSGSPTVLFINLAGTFGRDILPFTHANSMSRMLVHRSAQLMDRGISVDHGRDGTARLITITRVHPAVDVVKCPECDRVVVKIIKNPKAT
jgi:hypothetical protein